MDKTVINIIHLKDRTNDYNFWSKKSYEFRLFTLEQIRQEFNTWKYGTKQRFQRVYRIIKLK